MRIAIYARVSTDDQHTEGQLDTLRSYCERRDAECVEYVDHGVSGRKDRRPALDDMMAAARRLDISREAKWGSNEFPRYGRAPQPRR